jgi:hypothetical protein
MSDNRRSPRLQQRPPLLTLSCWSDKCRQIRNWGHTPEKAKEIQALTVAWADYILKKRGAANKLPEFAYLTEAEPFLAAYMQKGEAARRLVGNADVSTVGVTYGHLPAGLKDELEDHKDEVVQGKGPPEAGEAGQVPEGGRASASIASKTIEVGFSFVISVSGLHWWKFPPNAGFGGTPEQS